MRRKGVEQRSRRKGEGKRIVEVKERVRGKEKSRS